MMYTKDSIEAAYCFFHQKLRIYNHSTIATQKDDIEYSIASYVEGMNQKLYLTIAEGKKDFLTDHTSFADDMRNAVDRLERMMSGRNP